MKKTLVLLFVVSFLSCKKDELEISLFTGNDIDSVTWCYISNNGDTASLLSYSCGFSEDRNIITFKRYDHDIFSYSEVYNIINNRLETTNEKFSTKIVCNFNHNKFLTLSVFSYTNKPNYDSTLYFYNSSNQLYQTKRSLYYGNTNPMDSFNSILKINSVNTYFWSNENIIRIKHDEVYTFENGTKSIKTSNTNLEYSDLENPLDYYYGVDALVIPFLRMGRACKNLVSRIEDGQTSNKKNYTYELSPNNNSISIHETSEQSTGTGTIYKYHY